MQLFTAALSEKRQVSENVNDGKLKCFAPCMHSVTLCKNTYKQQHRKHTRVQCMNTQTDKEAQWAAG